MEIVFRPFNERSNGNTNASSIAEYGVVTISSNFTLGTGITQYAPTRISIYQIINMNPQTKNEIIAERERERKRESERERARERERERERESLKRTLLQYFVDKAIYEAIKRIIS